MATDFGAGCVGGMAGVVVGHPLDTVKVRMQTQCAKNPQYRGTYQCLRSIAVNEGMRGLYRGMSSPLVGVAAVNALTFGIQGNVRRLMRDPDSLSAQCRAGMIAGGAQAVVVSPMELVKSRMQVQSVTTGMASRHYTSSMDCCRQLLAREGLRGLMRGYWITVVREVPAFGLYFGTYELLTTGISGDGRKSFTHMLMAGGLAGVSSWVFTYPIDVVKTRLQTDGMSNIQQYSGYVDCIRKTYQNEGWRAFMRGCNSASVRAFPTNAVTFATVSVILDFCQSQQTTDDSKVAVGDVIRHEAHTTRERRILLPAHEPHAVTITQMTVEVDTADTSDAQRRRRATIRLEGQMALHQLRQLLEPEIAALQGRMATSYLQAAFPLAGVPMTDFTVRSDGTHSTPAVTVITTEHEDLEPLWQSEPEEAGRREDDEESDLELKQHREGFGRLRRQRSTKSRILEYDVGDVDVGANMSRLLKTA